MKHTRWIALLLVLCLLSGLAVLPGASSAEGLNKKKLTLVTGATFQLVIEGVEGQITWKSSSKKIAKVSGTGLVKASKPGKCTITAKVNGKTYKCKVTVKQGVKKIKLNKKNVSLKVGDSLKLKATVSPDNAANKKVKWESDNPDVATVSKKGVVQAVGGGTATITATAADGSGKTAKCTVTVKGEEKNYTLGSFSKFVISATYDSAADYLKSHENDSGFWNLINESWIYEDAVTTIEKEGIFVFARCDAVVFNADPQPIRDYRLYDQSGNFKMSVLVVRADDHMTAVNVAETLNQELKDSGTDSWGYYGKTEHFACGNCLVTLEGIPSQGSDDYGKFSDTVNNYRNYNWTIHAY